MSHTDEKRKHAGRIRELFPALTIIIAIVALLFIGSAVIAIVASGITHFHEALTSAEVMFSLRISVVTSVISTAICLVLALPTAYALSHTNMPCKRIAGIVMELTLSLPYILLGFALLLIFSSPFGKALKDIGFAVVFQPAGIVFAQLIVNLPFAIRMVRTALDEVNPRHGIRRQDARSELLAGVSRHHPAPSAPTRSSRAPSSRGRAAWASSARRSCSSASHA